MAQRGEEAAGVTPREEAAVAAAERASESEDFAHRNQDEELAYRGDTRRFRGTYAKWLLGLLVGQLLATNLIFLLVGLHCLNYDTVTLRIFIGATIFQVIALVTIVVRHLFPLSRQ